MGLAASQARLLLLTAKNDALEFQAQKIEEERLMLAQEQEVIAAKYSEKTSNTIYVCSVPGANGNESKTLTLDSLAQSMAGTAGGEGTSIIIADANGNPIVEATAKWNGDSYDMIYKFPVTQGNDQLGAEEYKYGSGDKKKDKILEMLNQNGLETPLQQGLKTGGYQILVQDTSENANKDATDKLHGEWSGGVSVDDKFFVRKSPESLSSVTSRYYTEDDAAAQAEYNTELAKVNALDTKLENKLNQIETQKKAIDQERESITSIRDSNIERTFSYFT